MDLFRKAGCTSASFRTRHLVANPKLRQLPILIGFTFLLLVAIRPSYGCEHQPVSQALAENNIWFCRTQSDLVFVFVHGFMSNSLSAWLVDEKNMQSPYWPRIVAEDALFGPHSIFLAGYYADWKTTNYGIRQASAALQQQLLDKGVLEKKNIIFVAHSLGGVVVRHMLFHHRTDFEGRNIGLLLYASPSLGSDLAGGWLGRLGGSELVAQLAKDSEQLKELDQNFRDLVEASYLGKPGGLKLRGAEYVEDLPLVGFSVVKPESASQYFGSMKSIGGSNHWTIVKPTSEKGDSHVRLRNFFRDFVKDFAAYDDRFLECFRVANADCTVQAVLAAVALLPAAIPDNDLDVLVDACLARGATADAADLIKRIQDPSLRARAFLKTALSWLRAGKNRSASILVDYLSGPGADPSLSTDVRYTSKLAAVALLAGNTPAFERFRTGLRQSIQPEARGATGYLIRLQAAATGIDMPPAMLPKFEEGDSVLNFAGYSLLRRELENVFRQVSLEHDHAAMQRVIRHWAVLTQTARLDNDVKDRIARWGYADVVQNLVVVRQPGRIPGARVVFQELFPTVNPADWDWTEGRAIAERLKMTTFAESASSMPASVFKDADGLLTVMARALGEDRNSAKRIDPSWFDRLLQDISSSDIRVERRVLVLGRIASLRGVNGDAEASLKILAEALLHVMTEAAKQCVLRRLPQVLAGDAELQQECGKDYRMPEPVATALVSNAIPNVAAALADQGRLQDAELVLTSALDLVTAKTAPLMLAGTLEAEKARLVSASTPSIQRFTSEAFFIRYYAPGSAALAEQAVATLVRSYVRVGLEARIPNSARKQAEYLFDNSDYLLKDRYEAFIRQANYAAAIDNAEHQSISDARLYVAVDAAIRNRDAKLGTEIVAGAGTPRGRNAELCNRLGVAGYGQLAITVAAAIPVGARDEGYRYCVGAVLWWACQASSPDWRAAVAAIGGTIPGDDFALSCVAAAAYRLAALGEKAQADALLKAMLPLTGGQTITSNLNAFSRAVRIAKAAATS